MRCFGGFFGFVDGYNLDLRNLIFLFIVFDFGDIVFFISDGVSDNFDFVIAQCKYCEIFGLRRVNSFDLMLDEILKSKSKFEEDNKGGFMGYSFKSDYDIFQFYIYDFFTVRYKAMLDEMIKVNVVFDDFEKFR